MKHFVFDWNKHLGFRRWFFGIGSIVLAGLLSGCNTVHTEHVTLAPKWGRFELTFSSMVDYTNPVQQATLRATFVSPSGEERTVWGFWDGVQTWRVRFAPNEMGRWKYATSCSDTVNLGLHGRSGTFLCSAPIGPSRFSRHGPVKISRDNRSFVHDDGTPFFWMADTGWNAALLSTPDEWQLYLRERALQNFTAVQWVTTQWRAAPGGDRLGELAFTGKERVVMNPAFFQRLDAKIEAMNYAGLLSAPVLLWAIGGGSNPDVNPGYSLPEDQAIILARYMVARWGANAVTWFLGGDGDYRGAKAERWKRIGRAVFGDIDHAPVTLHPGGMHWYLDEFREEKWLSFVGYQSGHGDDPNTLKWIFAGPPATDWKKPPARPFINLEPPYENHIAYQSKKPHSPASVRRAIYWSLLIAPTAGVTYGGHGVWGWDDGTKPPADHPNTGIPLPWKRALAMPAAEQISVLTKFFSSIDFWRLRPAPNLLVKQPGAESADRFIAAARSEEGDLVVVYVPAERNVALRVSLLPPSPSVVWVNPRTGERQPTVAVVYDDTCEFVTPGDGDWLLLAQSEKK
jgi:hypothetical protein